MIVLNAVEKPQCDPCHSKSVVFLRCLPLTARKRQRRFQRERQERKATATAAVHSTTAAAATATSTAAVLFPVTAAAAATATAVAGVQEEQAWRHEGSMGGLRWFEVNISHSDTPSTLCQTDHSTWNISVSHSSCTRLLKADNGENTKTNCPLKGLGPKGSLKGLKGKFQ